MRPSSLCCSVANNFNGMDELSRLQQENAKLRKAMETMDESAKMLIRRDIQLRRAYEEMKLLERTKSEFVSIAAHQLRTPLSAIRWSLQMLLDEDLGPLNDNQKKLLDQSQISVKRMVRLVNNLLDADHLELGNERFTKQPVELVSVLDAAVTEMRPLAEKKAVALTFTKNLETATIEANPDRLKEVFLNLLDNAIKYTPENGSVTIGLEAVEGQVVCTITDTGIGVPTDQQGLLFGRFMRAENAKRVDADGSGLGLYIVKKIVENHRGAITCVSEENHGTTFTLMFPLVTVN